MRVIRRSLPSLQTTCDSCNSEIAYCSSEIEKEVVDCIMYERVVQFIVCPVCKSKVIVNSYLKEKKIWIGDKLVTIPFTLSQ